MKSKSVKVESTNYGWRLASRNPVIRYEAKAELERLGEKCDGALRSELTHLTSGGSHPSIVLIALMFVTYCFITYARLHPSHPHHHAYSSDTWPFLVLGYWLKFFVYLFGVVDGLRKRRALGGLLPIMATRNEPFATAPMLSLCLPASFWQPIKPDPALVAASTALIDRLQSSPNPVTLPGSCDKPIRAYLTAHYAKRNRILNAIAKPRRDFSEPEADLLATLIRLIAGSSYAKDRELVMRIASARETLPNRQFVQEIATVFIAEPFRGKPSSLLNENVAVITAAPAKAASNLVYNRYSP